MTRKARNLVPFEKLEILAANEEKTREETRYDICHIVFERQDGLYSNPQKVLVYDARYELIPMLTRVLITVELDGIVVDIRRAVYDSNNEIREITDRRFVASITTLP